MEDTVGKLKMLLEDVFVVVEGMMDLKFTCVSPVILNVRVIRRRYQSCECLKE